MGGQKQPSGKLNFTLLSIVLLLNHYKIKNWFVGYGTLLGLVRNHSCIENDDDIDIMIDQHNVSDIKKILKKHGFTININKPNFINTHTTDTHAQIDFYLYDVEHKNANDTWSNIVWSDCFPLIKCNWNMGILYLPQEFELKLKNRYGENWRIPQSRKIEVGKKYII
jgi:hypothetical protein